MTVLSSARRYSSTVSPAALDKLNRLKRDGLLTGLSFAIGDPDGPDHDQTWTATLVVSLPDGTTVSAIAAGTRVRWAKLGAAQLVDRQLVERRLR